MSVRLDKMDKTLVCLAALAALLSCVSAFNCTGVGNGIVEKGCKAYTVCNGGVGNTVECQQGMVFNNATNQCEDEKTVPPPCGQAIDCSTKANGRYPDLDQNCGTWYTCEDHKFFGHNYCPSGLVFDTTLSICNWPDRVKPPCGTMK